ncbi:MAG: hypothetical protein ACRD44_00605 [Bryobacteraceae bacterium]
MDTWRTTLKPVFGMVNLNSPANGLADDILFLRGIDSLYVFQNAVPVR